MISNFTVRALFLFLVEKKKINGDDFERLQSKRKKETEK